MNGKNKKNERNGEQIAKDTACTVHPAPLPCSNRLFSATVTKDVGFRFEYASYAL